MNTNPYTIKELESELNLYVILGVTAYLGEEATAIRKKISAIRDKEFEKIFKTL